MRLNQALDLGIQRVGGHDAIDQALGFRLHGVDEVAGEQHFQRRLAPEVARQADGRRRAEETDVDAGDGELGNVGGDRQVAHRHQLAAGGSGDAVHAGDDRLRQAGEGQHQFAALPEQCLHEFLAHGWRAFP